MLGNRLRTLRTARGLSQNQVAERLDISRAAVSQWETSDTTPQIENIDRLAGLLKCSVEWLRHGTGDKPDLTKGKLTKAAKKTQKTLMRHLRPKPKVEGLPVAELLQVIGETDDRAEQIHDWWHFPIGFVREVLRTSNESLRVFRVMSDDLEPRIPRGSYALIDIDRTTPTPDKYFVVQNSVMMRLRRCVLQEAEDKPFFALITDEKPEEIEHLPSNKYKIIGMCVGVVGVWV